MTDYVKTMLNEYLPEAIAKYARAHEDFDRNDFDEDEIAREMMVSTFEAKLDRSSWNDTEYEVGLYLTMHKEKITDCILSFVNFYFN